MRLNFPYILIIALVYSSFLVKGQALSEIPEEFDQINMSLSITNPSYISDENSFDLVSGYKGFNSLSNNIRTFYSDVRFIPSKNHMIGGNFFSDQEGKFIRHNRAYLKYAYSIQLKDDLTATLGTGVGLVNFNVLGNNVIGGFSDTRLDSKVGLGLKWAKWHTYLSVLQFLNRDLSLGNSKIKLQRYYQLYSTYNIYEMLNTKIHSGLFFRYSPNYVPDLRLFTQVTHSQFFGIASVNTINGFTIGVGIKEINLEGFYFSPTLSYRAYVGGQSVRRGSNIEITVNVFFKKENENRLPNE